MTTILLGGTFHMMLSLVLAITYRRIDYFNPISLLGLGPLFPGLLDSLTVTIIMWCFLVGLGFVVLFIQYRRKASIAVIRHHNHKDSIALNDRQNTNEETSVGS